MADARWSYCKPVAWAVIDGKTVDITGFNVSFELNAIPSGVVKLPLGRNLKTGEAATIHKIAAALEEQVPIEIHCEMSERQSSDGGIKIFGAPRGPFKVFEGFTAGTGYSKQQGAARHVIAVNGFEVKLSQSSAFSDSSHPGNPARLSYGALQPSGVDRGVTDWTALSQPNALVTPGAIAIDLWGSALYRWFLKLAEKDGMWIHEKIRKGDVSNSQALAALKKIGPAATGYVASKIRPQIAIDEHVADVIAADVAMGSLNPDVVANQTMWDLLIAKFCADYALAFVPRAENGLVVPFVPCNRDVIPQAQITAAEYSLIDASRNTPRPLRAFGLMSSIATRTGIVSAPLDTAAMGIGGWYDTDRDGSVIVQMPPRWMTAVMSSSRWASQASGGNGRPIRNALNPGAGTPNNAGDDARARAKATTKPLLDAFAKTKYAQEVLRNRWCILNGPMRFDICPGSALEIEGASEKFIADQDPFGQAFFGELLRVSLNLDADDRKCGVGLHVGYVRSQAENDDEALTVAGHPLYAEAFEGAPLIGP